MRDLLRLRRSVGIQLGILVIGKEGYEVASEADIKGALSFVQSVGLPTVNRTNRSTLGLCRALLNLSTHLVTDDVKLCQLSTDSLTILRPKVPSELEALTPATVESKVGVVPAHLATFLALHGDGMGHNRTGPLTKRQAIRLVDLISIT